MFDEHLKPTDALTGTLLDFDGKHLVVGAPGITSGEVNLYEPSFNEWVKVETLSVPGTAFGSSVSIQDDWLAVLAPGVFEGATVFLYRKTRSGDWVQSDFVRAPGNVSQIWYG